MQKTLFQASAQWATRPPDQRFLDLLELQNFTHGRREHSKEKVLPSRALTLVPQPDHKGLMVSGPGGVPAAPTHWAYGQLAGLTGLPHAAAFTRALPAELAADNVNYGIKVHRNVEDVKVLLYKNGGGTAEFTAVTGPGYGRLWNADLVDALVERFGDGRTGDFKIPGEFGKDVEITRNNTTLYASDRDLFVFLADEKNRFTVPNGRLGSSGGRTLARGFFVYNSEVGKSSYGIAMFVFDYVCMNRIVWGVEEVVEMKGRHTASAPEKFRDEILPAIEAFAAAPIGPMEAKLLAAQKRKVENLEAFLKDRKFSSAQIAAMMTAHQAEEGRPMETLWDVATGITAYARAHVHTDTRLGFERTAGRVLDLVAA